MRASTFTTYINAETDPGLEQAWARNTKLAQASYGTITQAAQAATRATAGLVGGNRSTAGIQGTARALGQQAQTMRQVTAAAASQERQSGRLSQSTTREAESTRRLTREHRNLAQSLNTTATAFSVVEGRMSPLAGRFVTVARAAEQLTGLQLGLAGVGATLYTLGRAGNEYATLVSRIRPFYESQKQTNEAMADIIGIAGRSRSALEPIVEIYARLKSNSDALGLSQQRVGRLTEFAAKAATLSGGTRSAREGALVQFSQAIGSNFQAGAGQEFNSLQEGASQVAILLAKYFKNADGSIGTTIGNLKKLSAEGKLTTAQIADAADRATPALQRMFDAMPKTLGTAGAEFSTAFTVMVGRLDESLGLTNGLAEAISLIAANLRVISGLIVGIAGGFAAIKLGGLIQGAAAAVRQTVIMQEAVYLLGQRRIAVATASQAQHLREVAALKAEGMEIRNNLILLQRKQQLATRDIVRATPSAGFAGSDRRLAAAQAERSALLRQQIQEQQRLNLVNGALAAANGRLATSTTAVGAASAAASSRMGLLASVGTKVKGVLGGLVTFLGGPWGIAFAVATTAVYLLATAQSAAARAADQMRDAQSSLASYIDRTTGKIIEQNSQLVRNRLFQAQDRQNTARRGLGENRDALWQMTQGARIDATGKLGLVQTGIPAGLTTASATYLGRPDARNLAKLQAEIDRYGKSNPAAARRINDTLTRKIESEKPLLSANAEIQALQGRGNPAVAARAFGEGSLTVSGGGGGTRIRTKSQIEAEAASRAARTETERARADLAKIRAEGRSAGETEDQYIDRLAAAQMAVKGATEAEKARRKQQSAGAAAARKEARDAVQDAKDEAAAKRDASLLTLEKKKPTLTQDEYLGQRIAILKTYDDEVNKLDASAAASNRTAAQMIADAKKVAEASAAASDKRRDIMSGYDDAPKAVDKANKDVSTLREFIDTAVDGVAFIGKTTAEIAEISKNNPLGTGIYTEEMAAADEANIERGLRKPMQDIRKEADRNVEIARLQLAGSDSEAEALRRTYQLVDSIGKIREGDYEEILGIVRQEQRINDLLESRSRITNLIQGTVDSTRDSFEQFLTDLPGGADKAAGNLFKSLRDRAMQISARSLTEQIFAGSDEKVRALLTGKANVDGALRQYIDTLGKTETSTDKLATAVETAAQRIDDATKMLTGGGGLGSSDVGTTPENVANAVANTIAGGSSAVAAIATVASKAATGAANDNQEGDIVVIAKKSVQNASEALKSAKTPSARDTYAAIGKGLGGKIDNVLHGLFGSGKKKADGSFDTSQGGPLGLGNTSFFGKLGDAVGKGVGGAATGAMVGGVMKTLGLKTSQTGAQIGGAIGSFIPIPGGDIIGSIAGGLIGGLFKKTKKGSSAVTVNGFGEAGAGDAVGNSGSYKKAATGLAGSVADSLNSIAEQLGGDLGSFGVSIGQRKKKFVVDPTGANRTKGSGVMKFDDEAEAIEYALMNALSDGAIKGISAASQMILKSGQDLNKAIQKALVIESIPKRLMQLTDPVRYAVTELNDEFEKMIQYLKEGGATAEQFGDAQKLYELERAKAIEQASEQASNAIQDFLDEITGGSSSPYSKRTTYNNAASQLDRFKSDIAGGKVVDQNDLLTAARAFQDASRELYGSSSSFFNDFEALRSLLEKARDNAGITNSDVTTLPASPFSDASVQDAIKGLQSATTAAQSTATDRIVASLDDVVAAVQALKSGSGGSAATSGALALLGF